MCPDAESQTDRELYPIDPNSVIPQPSILDTLFIENPDECGIASHFGTPQYIWRLPEPTYGDSAYSMRFDGNPLDTIKLVEFFVYNRNDGTFGNDDIYISIRDDSAGFPSTELSTDTIKAGTYPQWPEWTSVPVHVAVNGDFHIVLATSAIFGSMDYEAFISDDINYENEPRAYITGGSYWTDPRKWYSFGEVYGFDINFVIRVLKCGNEYTDCYFNSCNSGIGGFRKLPDALNNNVLAQLSMGAGDTSLIRDVVVRFGWPSADLGFDLFSDSAAIHVYEDNAGNPGAILATKILQPSDFEDAGIIPGFAANLTVDFSEFALSFDGYFWVGLESFAPDSTTGLRITADDGGGGCNFGLVQNSGTGWSHYADSWGLPDDIALYVRVQNCFPHRTFITVPTDFPTIQSAIIYSKDDDTILVLPGTYIQRITFEGRNINLVSNYFMTGDTSYIQSTIITSNGVGPIITFNESETRDAQLVGFTISNGLSNLGGGILCDGSSPTIIHNHIMNNHGGALGGGIACNNAGPLIEYNYIGGNRAQSGGGIGCGGGFPVINYNVIAANNADSGGALFFIYGSGSVNHTILFGNSAMHGGAIHALISDINTNWMTVANNTSEVSGIFNFYNMHFSTSNSIIAFNNPAQTTWDCEENPAIEIDCTDIFGNKTGDWNYCNGQSEPTGNNFSVDPHFCNWIDGNLLLNQYSTFADTIQPCGLIGALGVGCEYLCGDSDGDSLLTISDVDFLRQYYFGCDEAPFYFSAGDFNCDGVIDLVDIEQLSHYLISGTPLPCCP